MTKYRGSLFFTWLHLLVNIALIVLILFLWYASSDYCGPPVIHNPSIFFPFIIFWIPTNFYLAWITVFEIEILDKNLIYLHRIFGKKLIALKEIKSIEYTAYSFPFRGLRIKQLNGKRWIMWAKGDPDNFVAELKKYNPALEWKD